MRKQAVITRVFVRRKKMFVLDLDGTLAESKLPIDDEMGKLFCALLAKKRIAVIGGGKHELFFEQLVSRLVCQKKLFANLFLFPVNATKFFRYKNRTWTKLYEHNFTKLEIVKIRRAFTDTFREFDYVKPKKVWGEVIENRDSQVTFSALGQKAPVAAKKKWNKENNEFRLRMSRRLQALLPAFEVRVGGLTSIDVTKKGIDKAYGIAQIETHLNTPRKKMLFVGDAIFPGGNDYAVVRACVDYVKVKNTKDTKRLLRKALEMMC